MLVMFSAEKLVCARKKASLMISKLMFGDKMVRMSTTERLSWTEPRIAEARLRAKKMTMPEMMAFLDCTKKQEMRKPMLT